jgi:4-azaleucine resistance transporter AzlC
MDRLAQIGRAELAVRQQTHVQPLDAGSALTRSFRLSLPVAMAYVPLGIAFGVLVVTSGINWYWAPLSALAIFAGSIEFLSIGLAVAGVAISQVALTAFVVNFRHIFYGLSFPIAKLIRKPQKVYGVFALTDETYGIVCAGREGGRLSGGEITALQVISHGWWVGGALLGAIVGGVIPPTVEGFGFALTSMFLALTLDAAVPRKRGGLGYVALAVVCAISAKLVEKFLVSSSFLIVGLVMYVAGVTLDYHVRRWRAAREVAVDGA